MSNSVTPWTVAHQTPLSMGILQARILEQVAMPSFKESPQSRDQTQVSRIAGGFFTVWATREALDTPIYFPVYTREAIVTRQYDIRINIDK